jgi:hypothetical protein
MLAQLNEREVEIDNVEDVDARDYPDFCDAHFTGARWTDTGEELSDSDYEQLHDTHADLLWEMAYGSLH